MFEAFRSAFPPPPPFTDKDLPDQYGKTFLITGASSGLGKILAGFLYGANGKVWMACRSESAAKEAMSEIRGKHPDSRGNLYFLALDLGDLVKVADSAREFLRRVQQQLDEEDEGEGGKGKGKAKLHVLWNNAGVMLPPDEGEGRSSVTAQGWEMQMGVNALGHFLFTKMLMGILRDTAATSAEEEGKGNNVRVVWLSSSVAGAMAPEGGVDLRSVIEDFKEGHQRRGGGGKKDKGSLYKYAVSKAANTLYSAEMARRYGGGGGGGGKGGIVSVSLDPGTTGTGITRNVGTLGPVIESVLRLSWLLFMHDPIYGAYTELYAGMSPDITLERNNAWVHPWGRIVPLRKDIADACLTRDEGGTGNALDFWEWSEEQVKDYI